jgi:hypothetical protein
MPQKFAVQVFVDANEVSSVKQAYLRKCYHKTKKVSASPSLILLEFAHRFV